MTITTTVQAQVGGDASLALQGVREAADLHRFRLVRLARWCGRLKVAHAGVWRFRTLPVPQSRASAVQVSDHVTDPRPSVAKVLGCRVNWTRQLVRSMLTWVGSPLNRSGLPDPGFWGSGSHGSSGLGRRLRVLGGEQAGWGWAGGSRQRRKVVKYIREVSPLFKKPSMVADLPWEGTRSNSPSLSGDELPKHSPGTKDRKIIPLKMSFISRNLTMPDLENRLLELHSPDGQHTVVLRCKDATSAQAWFTAIHTNIAALLPQTLAHVNAYLSVPTTAAHPQLKHIGWLAEQIQLEGGRIQYRPVVMALTEKDILLFDSVPWSRDAWTNPLLTHPILATRLVHSGSSHGSPAVGADLVFATRTGTNRGIESHVFRVETHWDLSSWTRALVQGGHAAAELIKEVSIGCVLNRQEVRLTLHYEKGFTVSREPAEAAGFTVLFRYPYEKLKMSADDGVRKLYLDFGGPEGELVFDLRSGPKPVVFVLHSFLSAKLTRMGLLT
ncbi:hypothetical protein AALO_G00149450 [Alosa alosa]|uniref:PH domain-containing protein n=1 Tax=Alosa alosa TaxID=278164 RepID=A0AAV6GEM0_9TELE|nr:hypothetical protein AALO_G00149450 [Alosa alosa]